MNHIFKIAFSFLILFTFCSHLSAQTLKYPRFRQLTVLDGLPQNTGHEILQDKDGFIWIVTGDGLCKYDGFKFTVFRKDLNNPKSFASGSSECMTEDGMGNIWVGSRGDGLSVYQKKTNDFKNIRINDSQYPGLPSNYIWELVTDDNGNVWIGTDAGICYFQIQSNKFIPIKLPFDSNQINYDDQLVNSIFPDGDIIWFGTKNQGLIKYDTKNKTFQQYKNNPNDTNSIIDNQVISIAKDKDNVLWIGTRKGLSSLNLKHNLFKSYTHSTDIHSLSSNDLAAPIFVDSRNNVWIGTYDSGINIYDRELNYFYRNQHNTNNPNSISSNIIYDIFEDRSGLIWIGTSNGISIYNPYTECFINYQNIPGEENTINGNHVNFMRVHPDGKIWIGLGADGLDILNPENSSIEHLKYNENDPYSLPSKNVRDVAFDKDGKAYIIISGVPSVYIFDPQTKKFTAHGGEWGKTALTDNYDNIWVSSKNGFGTVDSFAIIKRGEHPQKDLQELGGYLLQQKDNDHIWLGTANIISIFNTVKRTFQHFDVTYSIFAILNDSKNQLWMASSAGLLLLDNDNLKIKKVINTTDGLSNNLVSSIMEDAEGNLWMGTNFGLNKYSPSSNQIESFTYEDGLPNNEFNMGSLNLNGEMYFSTVNGVLRFDPLKITRNKKEPPVVITRISILNENYNLTNEEENNNSIELNHKQYFFTIEFAALDFVQSKKNQYAYKLEGFNDDWVYIGNKHEVTFTNLDPGKYVLHIKASNSHGVWNEKGTRIEIIILPPWWKTWWFRITLSLTLILLIVLFFRWRTANLKKQKNILESTVKLRTAEVIEQKEIIEEKQKEIIHSINYAQRLQKAILAKPEEIKKYFSNSFLIFMPKDIVAGDFYFFEQTDSHLFYAAADCTGHGVPGAMVSVVCSNALTRCVKEFQLVDPASILNKTRELVLETFRKSGEDVKDGMDISLIVLEKNELNSSICDLKWAGANNSLVYIKDGVLLEIKADKQPIGATIDPQPFHSHEIQLGKNDYLFLITDGYADQFGGPKGKKFKYSNLQKLLLEISTLPPEEAQQRLIQVFNGWKGPLEQVDDICIIGIKL